MPLTVPLLPLLLFYGICTDSNFSVDLQALDGVGMYFMPGLPAPQYNHSFVRRNLFDEAY